MPTTRSGRVGPHGFSGGGVDLTRPGSSWAFRLGMPGCRGARNHGGVILLPPPTIFKVLDEGADT